MPVFPRARTTALALLAGAGLIAAAAIPAPALADTRPPSGTPTTVSTDPLPTAQLNGVAWTQLVVGDTVYVGGNFSRAQPAGAAAGVSTVARANMLAYDLRTGVLRSGFAPSLNGEVRALAASPDGSTVYAGGSFTSVNGTARSRLVALDAATGAVRSGFAPSVNGTVYALATSGSQVYLGGSFSSVAGTTRTRAAAVTTAGAVSAWAPSIPDGTVRGVAVNAAVGKVALVGSFSTLNGGGTTRYRGSGMVDLATGRVNAAWSVGSVVPAYGADASMLSVSSDGTNVYGTAYNYGARNGSAFEGTFAASWADGSIRWLEDCHGDTYGSAPLAGAVYIAGHPHYCSTVGGFPDSSPRTWHRGLAFSAAATRTLSTNTQTGPSYGNFAGRPAPSLLTWYPDFNAGSFTGQSQGPWTVAAGGDYVVFGGEFTTVNGVRQQGLVRFALPTAAPNRDGPRTSGAALAPTLTASGSTVRVAWRSSWDRDNAQLTYRVYRGSVLIATVTGSSSFWNLPTLSVNDAGRSGTVSYRVTASDPWGNTTTGSTASITLAAAARIAGTTPDATASTAPAAVAPAPAPAAPAPAAPEAAPVPAAPGPAAPAQPEAPAAG